MTIAKRMIAPPNSLIVIDDSRGGISPDALPPSGIAATSSRLLVGCMMFQDGETEIRLGPTAEVAHEGMIAFDGVLETPKGQIWITTVEGTPIAKQKVGTLNTRIRVWTNHPTEPDRIIVGWG